MIISLLQEKGGAGKTTVSIHLAYALKHLGHSVLLIDSDQQGSARDWHENNEGSLLEVIGLDRPTIDKDIQRFKKDYEFLIIDGAPHLSVMATKIIVCSDIILIPIQPSPYDVWASEALVELIKQRQEITGGNPKAFFVINGQIKNTIVSREVREVLQQFELPILENGMTRRIAYVTSAAKGETVFDVPELKNEVLNIANEVLKLAK